MSQKTTETNSHYRHIQDMDVASILFAINEQDKQVAKVVEGQLKSIGAFIEAMYPKFQQGGRLFYVGAGTSGRLGILDASEIPPTFGLEHTRVQGIIAGGTKAVIRSVEGAEDDEQQAINDLNQIQPNDKDTLLGITASGSTPYVLSACRYGRKIGMLTGGLCMNQSSQLSSLVDYPIEVVVGPEFITGSTRMKSGTAQKMVLNMISTSLMIRLGKVYDNTMNHMQLSNKKLLDRGARIIAERFDIPLAKSKEVIDKYGDLNEAILNLTSDE